MHTVIALSLLRLSVFGKDLRLAGKLSVLRQWISESKALVAMA